MKENVIKTIQKFLNAPFRYPEMLAMLDKQKDLLLKPDILNRMDDHEYNALWDTIVDLEGFFKYGNASNLVIGAELSVLLLFDTNWKSRKNGYSH